MFDVCEPLVPPQAIAVDSFAWFHEKLTGIVRTEPKSCFGVQEYILNLKNLRWLKFLKVFQSLTLKKNIFVLCFNQLTRSHDPLSNLAIHTPEKLA